MDKKNTAYLHLADGGLTDNLGLEAFKDILPKILEGIANRTIRSIIVISVNAATPYQNRFGQDSNSPLFWQVLSSQADLFLKSVGYYSQAELTNHIESLKETLLMAGVNVPVQCVNFRFHDIEEEILRAGLNSVPTRMALEDVEIQNIVNVGRFLVRKKAKTFQSIQKVLRNPTKASLPGSESCNLAF